ncbi:MAG: hypothetical protein IPH35_22490 [Rhodoferax sp.]|nr:hypothetical protein [Rhodoferax sp.]
MNPSIASWPIVKIPILHLAILGLAIERRAHSKFSRESTVLEGCKQSIQFLQGGAVGGFDVPVCGTDRFARRWQSCPIGLEIPPDQKEFQAASIWLRSSPMSMGCSPKIRGD